ncbi:MAG: mechanosensitive ion channel family protein [Methanosarcina thermophila]|jgi:small conductance mechanosensitive channel|uniref:Mechanosensitive ion channel n=1 Tax=Methanosarcina thermophila TaxID=2210 RepID=A0A1I7A639_METTE|nr:mechanosensitive ion channel family protein [Methanosarcina thermophila]ALK05526.1 MAG: mechanosensitive ion channel protein MscS [Methanosarcina sp. 795]NLU57531.1 mechanosensitive ion channel family protein [Methanosarcina thermophila]SFT70393.1 Mechanosensitive ion channel [Methanosarcina thermophila]BAW29417.1 mechanosensitive ion channel [Methanosarcina thermophila]GLI13538.1 mechanosensitive ion channel protein MscS [Methanosarcina thermophila MST-A1]
MGYEIMEKVIPYTGITISRLIFALIVLIAGFLLARYVTHIFKNAIRKTNIPDLTIQFLTRLLNVLFYVIIILAFLKSLNFDVDSYIVGVSAVIGLVLGLGMQDTFTNLTAGVCVSAIRPIDMGETVTVNGQTGRVRAVGVMSTELLTPDNQLITIPNKLVWGNSIVNMTRMPTRRVSVDVGISYSSDLEKAIEIAFNLMKTHPLVLQDPEPAVVTTELANSSINLQLRAWTKTENMVTVKNSLTAGILEAYTKEGIEIPFPQMDINIRGIKPREEIKLKEEIKPRENEKWIV